MSALPGSSPLWYKTIQISSRLVSTQKGTVSRRSHLREGQVNTKGEDLFHVSQAHRHPALPVTYSNQHFVVPFHILILDFFPFSHLCPFFLGEVYGNVFESIFCLRKNSRCHQWLTNICQTLERTSLPPFVQEVAWSYWMVSVRQGWRLFFPPVSCLTEQTLSIFLTLPGHRAVDDASVLFCPTPPHCLRQDQAFPSCVQSQGSSLSCPGKLESVVLQGPAPCPSYRAGLEPSFATSTSHRGLPLCSPSISLSAFLLRPVQAHGHGTASVPRCLWRKKKMLR